MKNCEPGFALRESLRFGEGPDSELQRIDTHCHVDLFDDPTGVVLRAAKVETTIISVTNLPSASETALPYVQQFRNLCLALGLHPLLAEQHSAKELALFSQNLQKTSYVGEIGLDFSQDGRATKNLQIKSLRYVLQQVRNTPKLLTVHSRAAESEVLDLLSEFGREGVIFHWFTGSQINAQRAITSGHYLSVNPAMLRNSKGRTLVESLPRNRVLLESDGPFVRSGTRQVEPKDLNIVEDFLSRHWRVPTDVVRRRLIENFRRAMSSACPN